MEAAAGAGDARVQVGLIVTPAFDAATAAELASELRSELIEHFPGIDWQVTGIRHGLLPPPAPMTELVDAARRQLLDHRWDLAVAVTELPLRRGGRPLVKHASPAHRVGLVSLPALGPRRVRPRLRESLRDVVSILIDGGEEPVLAGNLRLVLGMIRANHPWRFATRLSRAVFGAIAAASFAMITSDVWRLGTSLAPWRATVLMIASIGIAVVTLIAVHDLWERAEDPRVSEQVTLFNLVTAITLVFGVASFYLALFAVALAATALVIQPSLFEPAVHHGVGVGDYLRLAWFAASLATVGGALGGTLESNEAVREAAYAYRGDDEEVALNGNGGGLPPQV